MRPRAVFIDTDPYSIDKLLYKVPLDYDANIVRGKSDSSYVYANGYYQEGKAIID